MNASLVRAPFRCLRGYLILAHTFAFFGILLPLANAQLYTETTTVPASAARVSISGDSVLMGVVGTNPPHQDTPTYTSGVYVKGPSGWVLQQRVQHQGGDAAIDGNTLVVGNSVYVRSGSTWTLQQNIGLNDRMNNALQGDTLASAYPMSRVQEYGYITIFARSGTTWTTQATLLPKADSQRMGSSIAMDGNIVIAGTDVSSRINASPTVAYVFVRNGIEWTLEATLSLPNAGATMDVAVEGNTAAVSDPTNSRVGIFNRSASSWTLAQTLSGPAGSNFGSRIVMRGGVLAVKQGTTVNLYTRNASGWALAQTITGVGSDELALSEGGKALVTGGGQVYSVPPPPPPGSGWRDFDIGAVGVAGNSTDNGTTVTVRGSGADIWGTGDQFHYRTESLTGDGAIIARVTSSGTTHPWAKVGLMAREDIAPAARNFMALVTPGDHLGTQVRTGLADTTAFQDAGWAGAPIWLMIARSGDLFASYRSDDGDNWTAIGSATVKMPATIHVGLAVSSHDNSVLNTSTFSDIELVGLTPPPPPPNDPPAAPTNLSAGNQTSTTVALSWTDNSTDETGFEVQRSPGNGSGAFTVVTTTAANSTSYVDSGLTPNTEYTYRVRATRSGTFSANSNTFTVRTLADTNGGWTSTDIGNVGLAGSTSASGNAVTLNAAGEDIWNQADGFRFHHRQWTGDGSVTVRVAALTNTHAWAKAGVMIRESLAPGAANAAMLLTAANACGFQSRPTTGAATEFTSGAWVNAPQWVRITRSGNVFSGFVSPNGVNWTLVGSRTMALSSTVYVGLAASSHNTAARTTASFDNLTLPDGPPPPPPPSDWTRDLWGTASGSLGYNETTVNITTSGDDIWNNSDVGLFAWQNWSGGGEFVARLDSFTSTMTTHPWGKAGIMFRAGRAANAANAFVAITRGAGAVFQVRGTAGGASTLVKQDWNPGPGSWLKLKREGNVFSAYYSTNGGTTWVLLGTQTVEMPADVQIGFAVSSHERDATVSAVFSNISRAP